MKKWIFELIAYMTDEPVMFVAGDWFVYRTAKQFKGEWANPFKWLQVYLDSVADVHQETTYQTTTKFIKEHRHEI